jgi:hypothetical protein
MSERNGSLSPDQLRAVGAMSGTQADDLDGLDAEAVVGWLNGDPGFVARLNRARTYRAERLRADVRSLASDAVATLRELVSGPDVPPAVRLRASLAILEAADAMKAETIGSTSARGVRASMDHKTLIESLGG